jgi:NitT/TauT family transport system substrate-binding protein
MKAPQVTRREALKLAVGSAAYAAAGLAHPGRLFAADPLKVMNLGFALGIHCPPTKGLVEELPKLGVEIEMQRFQRTRDSVQAVIGGAGEVGVSGPIVVLRGTQAGNDLRILGNFYLHASLVVAANTDQIKSWKDFEKSDVTVGINSQGDITQVLIIGGLLRNGVDVGKVNWADVGGSGSRMRALLAKRIQATVIHFDQIPLVQKEGNYTAMLEPAKMYDPWVNEVVYCRGEWLERPENRDRAVKVMKAVISASRKANGSFDYYKDSFLKYATIKGKENMPDDAMRAYWDAIAHQIGVWPADNRFQRSNFEKLMPYYKAAKAVDADKPIDLAKVVDTTVVEQALKELG